jgi:hypothetical protein
MFERGGLFRITEILVVFDNALNKLVVTETAARFKRLNEGRNAQFSP